MVTDTLTSATIGGAMDSACTSHMFRSEEGWTQLKYERIKVQIAGGGILWATGRGTVQRKVSFPDGSKRVFVFKDSLLVPDLKYDLISTRRLDQEGFATTFSGGKGIVRDKLGVVAMFSQLCDGLYCVRVPVEKCATGLSGVDLLHRRFGHASAPYLTQWLSKKDSRKLSFCDACATMRARRRPFKHANNPKPAVTAPLDLVVSDLCGPFRVASLSGAKYFGTIIDVHTRFMFVFFLRTKDEAATYLGHWFTYIKTQTGLSPKVFQSDGGGEFVSQETRATFLANGTKFVTTAADSSNQNAIAERANGTLLESARAMMEQAGAFKSLWEEAVRYACYVRNLTPHSANNMRSPASVFPMKWMRSTSLYTSVRVWGCRCFVRRRDCKLSASAAPAVFVGVDMVKKGWRTLLDENRRSVISRDVVFDESNYPLRAEAMNGPLQPSVAINIMSDPIIHDQSVPLSPSPNPEVFQAAAHRSQPREPSGAALRNIAGGDSVHSVLEDQTDTGGVTPPYTYNDTHSQYSDCTVGADEIYSSSDEESAATARRPKFPTRRKRDPDPTVPNSYKQAAASPEAKGWSEGMDKEYGDLKNKHNTWEIAPVKEALNKGTQVIGCRWVYRKKALEVGGFIYKCRLTVKGFMQRYGVDYDDVFSSVAQLKSFRLIIALSAAFGCTMTQYDFDNAFVQSVLPKPVYMEHPEGYPGPVGTCLKLLKSLYGLKAAPKLWSELLRSFLITIGFIACVADQCIMFHSKFVMWLVTFSDDVIISTKNEAGRKEVVNAISKRFKIKILGVLSKYVGIEVKYGKNGTISISQDSYIRTILARFNMSDCKSVSTPAAPGSQLLVAPTHNDEEKEAGEIPYKSAVGSLWYASRGTRPDIEYSTNNVAQHASKFGLAHWQAVKRVFRYLSGSISYCITYFKTGVIRIVAYSDSDWAADTNNRRSKTGYVVFVAGGAVVWQTKSQKSVALSSCEAEYYAMTEAIKEILWLIFLLTELKIKFETPVLYVDNQGAIALAQNPVNHQRTKHIDIRFHFIREAIRSGKIIVEYVGTDENIADMLTKALSAILFNQHSSKMVSLIVPTQPLERCCLARIKHTNLARTLFPRFRDVNSLLRRTQRRRYSKQTSKNEHGCYLPCLCGWFLPYMYDAWALICLHCGEESVDLAGRCSMCERSIQVNPQLPYACTRDNCNNNLSVRRQRELPTGPSNSA